MMQALCVALMTVIYLVVTFRGKQREFGDSLGGLKHSYAVYSLFVPKRFGRSALTRFNANDALR